MSMLIVRTLAAASLAAIATGGATAAPSPLQVAKSFSGSIGRFGVSVGTGTSAQIRIVSSDRMVFASIPGQAFVTAAARTAKIVGNWDQAVEETEVKSCNAQTVSQVRAQGPKSATLTGTLKCADGDVPYSMTLSSDGPRLGFDMSIGAAGISRGYNRIGLVGQSRAEEGFYGFGTQFSYFDMKGRKLPVWISEQGFGRGDEPTTSAMNKITNSGGDFTLSYAGVPQLITSDRRGLFLDTTERAIFDMREADRFSVELFGTRMRGGFLSSERPLEMISAYTETHGRMRALPAWIERGAVLGVQGGTDIVLGKIAAAERAGTPIAALWVQDWVGQRVDPTGGKRLWWTWTMDKDRYHGWERLVSVLKAKNIRVMGYINPYLANLATTLPNRRDLFGEASRAGYLVKNAKGEPYMRGAPHYRFGMIDLTNRNAWNWYKALIKSEMIAKGFSGWMADFAEGLPVDAVLSSGVDPLTYHNQYADDWARLNREAADEAGLRDAVIFHRAGYSQAPKYATLFWLGDQQVEWGQHDGLKSAVTGMLTSGISGYAFQHSDIGGYTALNFPTYKVGRSKELFMRWAEMSAFTPVFRTHEGSHPDKNFQFDGDAETLTHFGRMASIYACLAPYRASLAADAANKGWPEVRHPFLAYPNDPEVRKLTYTQFMLGNDLMMTPVLDAGQKTVEAYVPDDSWSLASTGQSVAKGKQIFDAPIGRPVALVRRGSVVEALLNKCR